MDGTYLLRLKLDRESPTPLYKQIYSQVREDILAGRLKPGSRLPSARMLAADWEVSRITTEMAYGHLAAEGYLYRRIGSGTFVPEAIPRVNPATVKRSKTGSKNGVFLSVRGKALSTQTIWAPARPLVAPFESGLPDPGTLPVLWRRLVARQMKQMGRTEAGYGEPAGLPELRQAIASHITAQRGVRCTAEQIVITSGAQQAINLCARLLLDPGDEVWVEDPCYPPAVAALQSADAKVVPVPVDGEGLVVAAGQEKAPAAKLAYTTPSRQYPLGMSMSMRRRKQILEWASDCEGWIIEDDYDGELRYLGQPLQALQGLDRSGRVIYVGTFSKVLFPSLRIGYVVLPEYLVDHFTAAKAISDRHEPSIEQAVLAEFIGQGHFSTHLRRMRRLYARRQRLLLEISEIYWREFLHLLPSNGGLFMVGRLDRAIDDISISKRAKEIDLNLNPISRMYLNGGSNNGFMIGYAAFSEKEMIYAAKKIASIVKRN